MKKLYTVILFILVIIVITLGGTKIKNIGSVTLPLGRVYVQKLGVEDWIDAKMKMKVFDKDRVKTLVKSRCEIQFSEGKVLRIGEKTVAELFFEYEGEKNVNIESGTAWLNILLTGNDKPHTVRTPTAVCAIRGTVYRLDCDSSYSNYKVYHGSVAVTPFNDEGELEDSTIFVNVGEELTLIKNFEEYKRKQEEALREFEDQERNEFEQFQREQEEQFQEFKKIEKEDFQKFKSLLFVKSEFDQEKDRQLDWVKWNLERDGLIRR